MNLWFIGGDSPINATDKLAAHRKREGICVPNYHPASRCAASCLEKMKMKANAKTATITETFTVNLTVAQARRVRFIAGENDMNPSAVIALATASLITGEIGEVAQRIGASDNDEQQQAMAVNSVPVRLIIPGDIMKATRAIATKRGISVDEFVGSLITRQASQLTEAS